MMDSSSQDRSAARHKWPVAVRELGCEDPPDPGTPEARLACMWELALQSWRMTGRPLPDYERSRAPVRAVPLREAE